jgi:hypothetical protein
LKSLACLASSSNIASLSSSCNPSSVKIKIKFSKNLQQCSRSVRFERIQISGSVSLNCGYGYESYHTFTPPPPALPASHLPAIFSSVKIKCFLRSSRKNLQQCSRSVLTRIRPDPRIRITELRISIRILPLTPPPPAWPASHLPAIVS